MVEGRLVSGVLTHLMQVYVFIFGFVGFLKQFLVFNIEKTKKKIFVSMLNVGKMYQKEYDKQKSVQLYSSYNYLMVEVLIFFTNTCFLAREKKN